MQFLCTGKGPVWTLTLKFWPKRHSSGICWRVRFILAKILVIRTNFQQREFSKISPAFFSCLLPENKSNQAKHRSKWKVFKSTGEKGKFWRLSYPLICVLPLNQREPLRVIKMKLKLPFVSSRNFPWAGYCSLQWGISHPTQPRQDLTEFRKKEWHWLLLSPSKCHSKKKKKVKLKPWRTCIKISENLLTVSY